MSALPLPKPPAQQPKRTPRSNPHATQKRQQRHYQALAFEATLKIGVNIVISGAAIAALIQLLPYRAAQQTKLKEIQSEVSTTHERVGKVKADFNRYFDPRQAKSIIQEQTNLADPHQKSVVWEPELPTAEQP
ncbi:hypothetical protein [Myxacorys almedinensis]|uniref:Uncharacterized protein n=1 Tax=Myxacorys almedinensis A TaxID=2690445 RepID=A0A8J7YXQ0_9CYAN|nr:hypothetical protein [Myxacorys almedinensis]NDJ16044.1 hypothetical protein [Myxacorys almedinensis A]